MPHNDTQHGYIPLPGGRMHYLKWGNGRRLLLAFHGYGNDASIFKPFARFLGNEYTLLSFDLPHHGESIWEKETLLSSVALVGVVKTAMAEQHADKVTLMGYSMGGKVCLAIIENMPECIDQALLMASDGLTNEFYSWFFTRTVIGKKLFSRVLSKPKNYIRFMDWLKEKKLLDESRHKFAMKYIKTQESRDFLRKVWPGMSGIAPHIKKVKAAIRTYKIPVFLFMGINDKIMPPSKGARFKKGLDTVKLYVLERGHRVFDEENAGDIAVALLPPGSPSE